MKKYLIIIFFVGLLALAGFYFAGRGLKVVVSNEQATIENNSAENIVANQAAEVVPQEIETKKEPAAEPDKNVEPVAVPAEVKKEETKKEEERAEVKQEENKIKKDFKISNKLVAWGYTKADGRKIDTIVIHSSYNALGGDVYDVDKLIKEYKEYGVAPHYLIDRQGNVYRLVEDKNIAYHAGESKVPDGRKNVNNFSIGIELINTKTDEYTAAQYDALGKLLKELKGRYEIKYTLEHNQIAPGRKDDPWNFDFLRITN